MPFATPSKDALSVIDADETSDVLSPYFPLYKTLLFNCLTKEVRMVSVAIRIDEQTKQDASRIVKDFGFDPSSVTRAFYRQIVRERRIPLTLSYPEPNAENLESVRNAEEILATEAMAIRPLAKCSIPL